MGFSCSCVTEEERAWGGWQDMCDPGCGVWRRWLSLCVDPALGVPRLQPEGPLPSLPMVGGAVGALDTCPLTDGPQSGGVSFPVPPRPSLGLAKATCHTAMPSCPAGLRVVQVGLLPRSGISTTREWEAWGYAAGGRAGTRMQLLPSHQLTWIFY